MDHEVMQARWIDVELFEERAAIREYMGGMDREQAELEAAKDVIRSES